MWKKIRVIKALKTPCPQVMDTLRVKSVKSLIIHTMSSPMTSPQTMWGSLISWICTTNNISQRQWIIIMGTKIKQINDKEINALKWLPYNIHTTHCIIFFTDEFTIIFLLSSYFSCYILLLVCAPTYVVLLSSSWSFLDQEILDLHFFPWLLSLDFITCFVFIHFDCHIYTHNYL